MKNTKSKINKKVLVISCILIFLIIIGLVLILNNDKKTDTPNDLTISCSFEKKSQIMNISVKMKVDYVDDEFKYVKETYEMKLLDEKLIQNIDMIKQETEKRILEELVGINATTNFETTENSVIIKLEMDSENYELYNKYSKSLVGDDSLNYSEYFYGAESLEQHIESLGGECEYE